MADAPSSGSQWWFRAAGTEKIYGPVSPDALLGWAREGRIYPEDKVSSDKSAWGDARQSSSSQSAPAASSRSCPWSVLSSSQVGKKPGMFPTTS